MSNTNRLIAFVCLWTLCTSPCYARVNCTLVSPAMMELLIGGLTIDGATLVKKTARMIKSDDFQNIYFIAAEIYGKGMEGKGDIGLWATNSPYPGVGIILSVNSLALKSSSWPNGKKSQAKLSTKNQGARAAIKCVASASANYRPTITK